MWNILFVWIFFKLTFFVARCIILDQVQFCLFWFVDLTYNFGEIKQIFQLQLTCMTLATFHSWQNWIELFDQCINFVQWQTIKRVFLKNCILLRSFFHKLTHFFIGSNWRIEKLGGSFGAGRRNCRVIGPNWWRNKRKRVEFVVAVNTMELKLVHKITRNNCLTLSIWKVIQI